VLETVAGARVRGIVADADGSPVEGARVSANRRIGRRSSDADELPWEAYVLATAPSGRNGAYEIDTLVPGVEYEIEASAPERPSSPEVVFTAGSEPARVDLSFPRPRWLLVTVLEQATDAPVAGASLSASAWPESTEGSERIFVSSAAAVDDRTDDEGRARLGPLGPGRLHLTVEAAGFEPWTTQDLRVVDAPDGPTVTVHLRPGGRIAGRVLRPDGRPASGASVTLWTATGPGSASGTSKRTDGDGSFAFDDLGDGDRIVIAEIESEGLASERVPVARGTVNVELRLESRSILAKVLDDKGRPVASAEASYSWRLPGGGGAGTSRTAAS